MSRRTFVTRYVNYEDFSATKAAKWCTENSARVEFLDDGGVAVCFKPPGCIGVREDGFRSRPQQLTVTARSFTESVTIAAYIQEIVQVSGLEGEGT